MGRLVLCCESLFFWLTNCKVCSASCCSRQTAIASWLAIVCNIFSRSNSFSAKTSSISCDWSFVDLCISLCCCTDCFWKVILNLFYLCGRSRGEKAVFIWARPILGSPVLSYDIYLKRTIHIWIHTITWLFVSFCASNNWTFINEEKYNRSLAELCKCHPKSRWWPFLPAVYQSIIIQSTPFQGDKTKTLCFCDKLWETKWRQTVDSQP